MRKKIVAGNWKMNKSLDEGLSLVSEVLQGKGDTNGVEVVLATPFIHLTDTCALLAEEQNIYAAAQNCSQFASGAYTGEISASMVKSTGAELVILGHSERREYFNETSQQLATKVDQALENDLMPIFCCGESLEIREANDHFDYVCNQITDGLFHLSKEQFENIVIAYEPIWAIGTGKTASTEQAQEMHQKIRSHVESKYGKQIAQELSILYGGSCKPSNSPELFACEDVDGGLIGGASLNAEDFLAIVRSF